MCSDGIDNGDEDWVVSCEFILPDEEFEEFEEFEEREELDKLEDGGV